MNNIRITSKCLPGLHQSASQASISAQQRYFSGLLCYLILLIVAAFLAYFHVVSVFFSITSAALFLLSLAILVFIRVTRPDDTWYNGRAVAESVKTRAWRWMMRAEPYGDSKTSEIAEKELLNDLKAILEQNKSLAHSLRTSVELCDPISPEMRKVRSLEVRERLAIYVEDRIGDQSNWYWRKAGYNKRHGLIWFWISVALHATAVIMLLYQISSPSQAMPVEVIATAAGAALTWLQAKKHNELNSAYALAAHEIVLINAESVSVSNEQQLSDFVVNSEAAFSREHTQWVARKND